MDKHIIERLERKSIEVILENQHPSGAFIASPSFSQYGYSWMRDGAFIAYGLLVSGEDAAAARFLGWAFETVERYRYKIDLLEEWSEGGRDLALLERRCFLPARFTLEGYEDASSWPNFQIDGYGSLLWILDEYLAAVNAERIPGAWLGTVLDLIRYLKLVWRLPNSDCWEENEKEIHPSTLACVFGGLERMGRRLEDESVRETAALVRTYILENLHPEERFPKYLGSSSVDASLLWLALPFALVTPGDRLMRRTVERMEEKIVGKGGVKRFPEDTYYGGGEWIILSAWLGWYYLRTGRMDDAETIIGWIVSQADGEGFLPEQVLDNVNDPSMIEPWERKWGPVAMPLLWSHGMFLVLIREWKQSLKERTV